uniref:Uncharacterized protein n=1 Tax=Anopheles dirus TaxID=7168 RepID=A0A182NVZ9_9DIPT
MLIKIYKRFSLTGNVGVIETLPR